MCNQIDHERPADPQHRCCQQGFATVDREAALRQDNGFGGQMLGIVNDVAHAVRNKRAVIRVPQA